MTVAATLIRESIAIQDIACAPYTHDLAVELDILCHDRADLHPRDLIEYTGIDDGDEWIVHLAIERDAGQKKARHRWGDRGGLSVLA